jgi:DNA-binding transcriptional LysR family regulator
LREIQTGRIDLAIIRTEAMTEDLDSEPIAPIQHSFAVPRTLLRTKDGAEVFEGRPIPFAELGGDPFFAKTARATANALGLNLLPIIQVESFSLLMSAVESGTAAAFIPTIAAQSLPEQRFAQVTADQMKELNRSLSLVWYAKSAESRPAPLSAGLSPDSSALSFKGRANLYSGKGANLKSIQFTVSQEALSDEGAFTFAAAFCRAFASNARQKPGPWRLQ